MKKEEIKLNLLQVCSSKFVVKIRFNAIILQKENNKNLDEKLKIMEITHTNQVKNLGDKLNNAQETAQAAQQAASAAQAQFAAMKNSGGGGGRRRGWCVIL